MNTSVLHVPLTLLINGVGTGAASVKLSRASFLCKLRIASQFLSNTENEAPEQTKLDIIAVEKQLTAAKDPCGESS